MQAGMNKVIGVSALCAMGAGLAALGAFAVPGAVQAQTVQFNGTACPPGWTRGAYGARDTPDPGRCYDRRSDAERSAVSVRKPDRLDRCPVTYFTSDVDPMACASRMSNPPTIRIKGSGPCRAGEVEDWGIWCVSNYASMTRAEAATALRDWNAIYTLNRATPPRQADLPEGDVFTPGYIAIFGRVRVDGSPMPGSSAAAASAPARPAATGAPAPASAAARDTRVGSLSPQRRTATTWGLCPSHWVAGQPGSDLPDPDTCYPSQMATPIFAVASHEAPCPQGYTNIVSWCVAASRDMPTSQAAAAPAAAQASANCPAPATGTTAQQAGAALGGLLGGRRGNSQAGAALGGLLGSAAGQAAQGRCP
jgi:hypothetical protein